jgi:hypothetical protein
MPAVAEAVEIRDFSGGLNLASAPSQVAANETPFCQNMTLDERGGAVMRLGLSPLNGSALAGTPKNGFYWQSGSVTIIQIGATVYKTADWVTVTSMHTFTTAALAGFADFQGLLVAIHPVDGVFTSSGAAFTSVNTTVKGSAIAVWQNKLFGGGVDNTLYWSNTGSAAAWTTATDKNVIRDVDDRPISAVGVGQGMDNQGRPGLLVFKETSAYRVHDPATGAYTTIDADRGAAGPLAVTTLFDQTVVVGQHGLYATDGVTHLRPVSGKIAPLFTRDGLNLAQMQLACAGIYKGRMLFSVPRNGSSVNNLTLEYDPVSGWIVPHTFGLSCMTTFANDDEKLYGGAVSASKMYDVFKGGTDDGAAITAKFQTAWFEPANTGLCRFRRVLPYGRGQFDFYALLDYDIGQGEQFELDYESTAFHWGTGLWGTGLWGPGPYEAYDPVYSLGVGRAISLRAERTASTSATLPKLLQTGVAPETGAFAFYGARIDFTHLER